MITRKSRRESGRVYYGRNSKDDDIENYMPILCYWDDWIDHRDGFRDWLGDNTKIKHPKRFYCGGRYMDDDVLKYNKKNKLLLKRRKAKKLGRFACS